MRLPVGAKPALNESNVHDAITSTSTLPEPPLKDETRNLNPYHEDRIGKDTHSATAAGPAHDSWLAR